MTERERLLREMEKARKRILVLKNYLASKDYQTIREVQGGEPMDEETKKTCADARVEINELEVRINSDTQMLADLPEEEEVHEPEGL